MAGEYLRVDVHGLVRLAVLIDKFFLEPTNALAAEIRNTEKVFGQTPLDRRRLEWSIEQLEQSRERGEQRRIKRAKIIDDPRQFLGD